MHGKQLKKWTFKCHHLEKIIPMTQKPLDVLKRGLYKITQVHRGGLNAKHRKMCQWPEIKWMTPFPENWRSFGFVSSFTKQLFLEETRGMKNAVITDFFK